MLGGYLPHTDNLRTNYAVTFRTINPFDTEHGGKQQYNLTF